MAAVRAGKPVLCEKPLAPTSPSARQVRRRGAGAGRALVSVGFMRRFDPGYVELKAALDAGGDRRAAAAALRQPGRELRPGRTSKSASPTRRSTSSTSCRGCSARRWSRSSWQRRARPSQVPWPPGPAADPAPHRRRRAVHRRDVPQRPLRLRRPLRGRRRDRPLALTDRPGWSPTPRAAGPPATPADWRPRFADAYRLELQAWVDSVAAGAPTPAGHRAGRPDRERGRRGGHRVDARRWPLGRGRGSRAVSPFLHGSPPPPPNIRLPRQVSRPRVPDPMAAPALRWGVLGTGWIAERFTGSLRRNTRQQVIAVGSRARSRRQRSSPDRAGIGRAHGLYAELVADPEIDIVYVATPHNFPPPARPCSRSTRASTCWWRSRSALERGAGQGNRRTGGRARRVLHRGTVDVLPAEATT